MSGISIRDGHHLCASLQGLLAPRAHLRQSRPGTYLRPPYQELRVAYLVVWPRAVPDALHRRRLVVRSWILPPIANFGALLEPRTCPTHPEADKALQVCPLVAASHRTRIEIKIALQKRHVPEQRSDTQAAGASACFLCHGTVKTIPRRREANSRNDPHGEVDFFFLLLRRKVSVIYRVVIHRSLNTLFTFVTCIISWSCSSCQIV